MDMTIKRWTKLGLGTALVAGALTACGAEPDPKASPEAEIADPASVAPTADTGVQGEGEAGLGGEGEGGEGEGGVSISAAATDPIVFNAALAITEAHIIAARDAFAEGETQAAAEMFAHPVSEVLADMTPIFETRGVEDFSDLLIDASTAVFAGETEAQINARTDAIIAALRNAATKAPDNGSSKAAIAAGVAADQIERATDMYRAAAASDRYEPYLDGYGFYKAGETIFLEAEAAIAADDLEAAARIREALALLSAAYPTATRPEALNADQSALTVASSKVILAVRN